MMKEQVPLFEVLQSADRFTSSGKVHGHEPFVIRDYIECAINASAAYYEKHAAQENILLCELYLRQVFFHLIEAIESPERSFTFRHICLDSIHSPLFYLKRHYCQQPHGQAFFEISARHYNKSKPHLANKDRRWPYNIELKKTAWGKCPCWCAIPSTNSTPQIISRLAPTRCPPALFKHWY